MPYYPPPKSVSGGGGGTTPSTTPFDFKKVTSGTMVFHMKGGVNLTPDTTATNQAAQCIEQFNGIGASAQFRTLQIQAHGSNFRPALRADSSNDNMPFTGTSGMQNTGKLTIFNVFTAPNSTLANGQDLFDISSNTSSSKARAAQELTATNGYKGRWTRLDADTEQNASSADNIYAPNETQLRRDVYDYANGTYTCYKNGRLVIGPIAMSGTPGNCSNTAPGSVAIGGSIGYSGTSPTKWSKSYEAEIITYAGDLSPLDTEIIEAALRADYAISSINLSGVAPYQCFNMSRANKNASIPVGGTYSAPAGLTPTGADVRFVDTLHGTATAWQTVAKADGTLGTFTGGTWSGTLPNVPHGQGYCEVRYTNDPSKLSRSGMITIGRGIIRTGQSNDTSTDAPGQTPNIVATPYVVCVYNGRAGYNMWADAYYDCSYLQQAGKALYDKTGICHFFIDSAIGATNTGKHMPNDDNAPDSTYTFPGNGLNNTGIGLRMFARSQLILSNSGCILNAADHFYVMCWVGEADSGNSARTVSLLSGQQKKIKDGWLATYANAKVAFVKLEHQPSSSGVDDPTTIANPNGATDVSWNTEPAMLPGVDFSNLVADVDPGGGTRVHILDPAKLQQVGNIIALAFTVNFAENMLLGDALLAISGKLAIFSVGRKLVSAYNGPCIRVQRSSDGTQADIGFNSSGQLDTVALLAFVGTSASSQGYVATRYDQSGNGFNLTAITTGQTGTTAATDDMARIVINGNIQKNNGFPALKFDGSKDSYEMPAAAYGANGIFQGVAAGFISMFMSHPQATTTKSVFAASTSQGTAKFALSIGLDSAGTGQNTLIGTIRTSDTGPSNNAYSPSNLFSARTTSIDGTTGADNAFIAGVCCDWSLGKQFGAFNGIQQWSQANGASPAYGVTGFVPNSSTAAGSISTRAGQNLTLTQDDDGVVTEMILGGGSGFSQWILRAIARNQADFYGVTAV